MSTVNTHFTFNYSQPDEYRFSHDSVFLARQAFEISESTSLSGKRGLDLCAGSGIVGLDFLFHRKVAGLSLPARFDFLEIQEVYRPHFESNRAASGLVESEIRFVHSNYENLQQPEYFQKYDLILANPPYFLPQHGLLSPSEFKNRCRFFIDSDFPALFLGIANALSPEGVAYILLKDLPQHGWNVVAEAEKVCGSNLRLEKLGDIRGTLFLRITKP